MPTELSAMGHHVSSRFFECTFGGKRGHWWAVNPQSLGRSVASHNLESLALYMV